MNSDEHRAVREQLGAYALGQLDEQEALRTRAHLDGCARCRAELAAIAPLAGPLALVDPDRLDSAPTPPRELVDVIVGKISAERVPMRRRVSRWAVPVAAAAVALALGGWVGYTAAPKPAKLPLEPVAVQVLSPSINASAQLVPHTWGVEIKLTATGFDVGARYQVDVINKSGEEVDAGEFVGTGGTEMRCNLNSSVLRADAAGFRVIDITGASVLTSTF